MVSLLQAKYVHRHFNNQNRAHWGNPSTEPLSVYTQSGSGVLIHWIDLHLFEKKQKQYIERDRRDISFLTTVYDLF